MRGFMNRWYGSSLYNTGARAFPGLCPTHTMANPAGPGAGSANAPGTASARDLEQYTTHMLPSPPQMRPPIELRVKAALQQHTARPGSARRCNHTAIGQHPIVLNQGRQRAHLSPDEPRPTPPWRASAEGQALPALNAWQANDGEEEPNSAGASSRKKQGAWQNAGGPGSASSMKREPIYDKETRTLYGLNPMELDALKQRFSMRASPQEDSLEQDDVPGQDGWRKDGWREDDWGRDGWREDTWDKDGWDNDGWREDGSGNDGWREDGSGNDDWGKDWREDSENSWDNIGKTSRDMRKQEQPGEKEGASDWQKQRDWTNSDEPGSASSSTRASFKHPRLRDAMEKWAEQASMRENKALDIARKSKANQQRAARDTHREWLDRKYLKRTLKRLAK